MQYSAIQCNIAQYSTISSLLQDPKALINPSSLHKYNPHSSDWHNDIPLNARQSLTDDHSSMSLGFFSLPLATAPNDGQPRHPNHYVSACTWDRTRVLCVPRRVCYPLGHSGRLRSPWILYPIARKLHWFPPTPRTIPVQCSESNLKPKLTNETLGKLEIHSLKKPVLGAIYNICFHKYGFSGTDRSRHIFTNIYFVSKKNWRRTKFQKRNFWIAQNPFIIIHVYSLRQKIQKKQAGSKRMLYTPVE